MIVITPEGMIHRPKIKPVKFELIEVILEALTKWIVCILDKFFSPTNPERVRQILQFAEKFINIKVNLTFVFEYGKELYSQFVAKTEAMQIQIKMNGISQPFNTKTMNCTRGELIS